MKNLFLLTVATAFLLSGCDSSGVLPVFTPSITEETISTVIPDTQVSETSTPEPDPISTAGLEPDITQSSAAPIQNTGPTVEVEPTLERPCNLASAGNPLDVTIPDNTRLAPNEPFSKIWRLVNSGTCTWTSSYALVWFSGDDFRAPRIQPVLSNVAPGESADFAVDMTAPESPGLYSSYWMVRSDTGDLFGIGPSGDSPFWVRIQVVAVETPTPTTSPTAVPTSVVFFTGQADLVAGQALDLDTGETGLEDKADAMLEQVDGGLLQWTPLNQSRFAIFGLSRPGELECSLATLSGDPININELEPGIYLCYRIGAGLPGMLQIDHLLLENQRLQINFTTWVVP